MTKFWGILYQISNIKYQISGSRVQISGIGYKGNDQ